MADNDCFNWDYRTLYPLLLANLITQVPWIHWKLFLVLHQICFPVSWQLYALNHANRYIILINAVTFIDWPTDGTSRFLYKDCNCFQIIQSFLLPFQVHLAIH
jgi:hypothetical protein